VALVVRTWNVFHGNAVPPERDAFLEQVVRLVAADDPDVVCLQEVPIWALAQLEEWSAMAVAPAVARPPRLGPFPWPAEAGRVVTDLNHGLLRSAFTGQANAILVDRRHRILDTETIALNERGFRRAQTRWLSLDLVTRLAWAKEGRVCQAARIAVGGADETVLVANLHTTSYEADQRIADAELRRAAAFVEGLARPGEPVVLCGDMNLFPERSRTIHDLRAEGFSEPVPQRIDQVLVRGLPASPPTTWPEERRRVDGRLLSDHAPVEAVVG
jgi:endonuclease/exonuclease/phosphatase family metal-dependent hydrolase